MPDPGQARIKVAATALNPMDAAMRSGVFRGEGERTGLATGHRTPLGTPMPSTPCSPRTPSHRHAMSERRGIPLTVVVSAANRNDHRELETVVDAVTPDAVSTAAAASSR
ncbi:hypothetical protein [Streptomyces regalis]|uniref:hypothetical protein n=1 Tax=Streptomyces regalis TaxID=68262 RepID=UPI00099E4C74|nr:hypothetical protein [Streptomyces regalis]